MLVSDLSGEAMAVLERARATAEGLKKVSESMKANGGPEVGNTLFVLVTICRFFT